MTQLEKEIQELENLIKFWIIFKPEFKGLAKLKVELINKKYQKHLDEGLCTASPEDGCSMCLKAQDAGIIPDLEEPDYSDAGEDMREVWAEREYNNQLARMEET